MRPLNKDTAVKTFHPEKIIQFGEGNFLRGFVDWMVSVMNEKTDFDGSAVVVQPRNTQGRIAGLLHQDGLYHVHLQGLEHGRKEDSIRLVDVISRALSPYADFKAFMRLAEQPDLRFVISNTTEAGIVFDPSCRLEDEPASSFPGKLLQLLYHRYRVFGGDSSKGWIILPCELIFRNGDRLKEAIGRYIDLWELGTGFRQWFETSCAVYSTLVDRIVPGLPKKNIEILQRRTGYSDMIPVEGEAFHLWVIEAPRSLSDEFPADKAGLNVRFVPLEDPYHLRKVVLLNAPHTVLSPVAFLCGIDIVREACLDPLTGRFVRKILYEELLPTLDMSHAELTAFADSVLERFLNPFIDHRLTSIMLNAFPKYRTRVLPALKIYEKKKGKLPPGLVLGLAALICYYRGGERGDGTLIRPEDGAGILSLLQEAWKSRNVCSAAASVLGATVLWGEDLNAIPGLTASLSAFMEHILRKGMRETLQKFLNSGEKFLNSGENE